jgi:uncharacterized protein DUF6640
MDVFTDGNLVARILLSLVTIGYGGITILADINKTHATNPAWTPHARFHVVWQVASYAGIGLIALALIWTPGPAAVARLYLAAAFAAAVYGGFFIALFTMRLYGGRTFDENGYPPFAVPLGRRPKLWDVNVTAFSAFTVMLASALVLIARTAGA